MDRVWTPLILGGLENFEVVIFVGLSFCEILGGGGGVRAVFLVGKAGLRKEDACIVTKNDKYLNTISLLTF